MRNWKDIQQTLMDTHHLSALGLIIQELWTFYHIGKKNAHVHIYVYIVVPFPQKGSIP